MPETQGPDLKLVESHELKGVKEEISVMNLVLRAGENRRQHRNPKGCVSQGVLPDINAHVFHPIHKLCSVLSQWAKTLTSTKWHNSTDRKSYLLEVSFMYVRVSIQDNHCIRNSSNSRFLKNIY